MPDQNKSILPVLEKQLAQELPETPAELRRELAHLACGEAVRRSMREVSQSLLETGLPMARLFAALLRCEWIHLQHLLRQSQDLSVDQEIAYLTSSVDHFNDLQASIIDAAEQRWQTSVKEERKARILAECKAQWLQERQIELHNYFHELPVKATARVLDVNEGGVDIRFSKQAALVFSAAPDMQSAWAGNAAGTVRIRLHGTKRQGNTLSLSFGATELDPVARRKHVRVRLLAPIPAVIEGKQPLDCQVVDMSIGGLGLLLPDKGMLAVGKRVQCAFSLGSRHLKASAVVRWNQKVDGRNIAGVEITPPKEARADLLKAISAEQRKIIGRLRQLGVPPWLKGQV